jgi:hypothetical protein
MAIRFEELPTVPVYRETARQPVPLKRDEKPVVAPDPKISRVRAVERPAKEVREVKRRGRARIENRANTLEATKPWVAAGMSRRTWFNRRAEERRKI